MKVINTNENEEINEELIYRFHKRRRNKEVFCVSIQDWNTSIRTFVLNKWYYFFTKKDNKYNVTEILLNIE